MKTIWKFAIPIEDAPVIPMPAGAAILHVGLDPSGNLHLWALVDDQETKTSLVHLYVVGTGHPADHLDSDDASLYLGSFKQDAFIWHVFMKRTGGSVGLRLA